MIARCACCAACARTQTQRRIFFCRTPTRWARNCGGGAALRRRKFFFRPRRKSRAQSAICAKLRKIPQTLSRHDVLKFVSAHIVRRAKFFDRRLVFLRSGSSSRRGFAQRNPAKAKTRRAPGFVLSPRNARRQCSSLSINSAYASGSSSSSDSSARLVGLTTKIQPSP